MQVGIEYGRKRLEFDVPESALAAVRRHPAAPPVTDVAVAVRAALETPHGFPALRRALTPDDHVTIVVDEHLPRVAELLTPILEHLADAHVGSEAVTLLCAPSASKQAWVEDLPEAFEDVHVEVHDPANRKRLSYLATTKHGRRVYLNRTAVDADQLVVLSSRGYDPLLGYSGAQGALYPALSDEATRQETRSRLSMTAPGGAAWPVRQEAEEVAWLLGAPFLVQIIAGAGEEVAHVVGGSLDSAAEGRRLLDARWRLTLDEPVHTVIASMGGDPARHGFDDLAHAAACAARVVQGSGRIVLLTQAAPTLGPEVDTLRQAEDPAKALEVLRQTSGDTTAAYLWASAAQKAKMYLLSGLDSDVVEELFATPLEQAEQAKRLISPNGSCLVLPDAHKALAVIEEKG
jgi:nickel-dependent lactate racemase